MRNELNTTETEETVEFGITSNRSRDRDRDRDKDGQEGGSVELNSPVDSAFDF